MLLCQRSEQIIEFHFNYKETKIAASLDVNGFTTLDLSTANGKSFVNR